MITVTESAVDWLTVIAKGPRKSAKLIAFGKELIEAQRRMGNQPAVFQTYGYWGEHCGAVSIGRKEDRVLLQVSGYTASAYYEALRDLAVDVTRVDLQVTMRLEPPEFHLARDAWQGRPIANAGKGALPRYSLYEDSLGGETLYVGRGASFQMGRLYNKGAEKSIPEYVGCWRWEVQLRREVAYAWVKKDWGGVDLGTHIYRYINAWYTQRGITLPVVAEDDWILRPPPKPVTDFERKLAWLRHAVRPTVQYLCQNNLAPSLLSALGIDHMLDITSLPEFPASELNLANYVKEKSDEEQAETS